MTSKASQIFDATLKRAQAQLLASERLHERYYKTKEYNDVIGLADMARSGIILTVGAMDSFFTRRFCELLVPHLKTHNPNKQLVTLLEDAGLNLVACLKMFAMDRPYRRVRSVLENHLLGFVTQNFRAIDRLYKCYSIPSLSTACAKRSNRKTLLVSVEKIVRRRHSIAHGGDLTARGNLVPIDLKRTKKRVRDVSTFVRIADEVLDDRFSQ